MADHARGEWSDVYASFARMGVADGVAIHHTASLPQGGTYDPAYLRRVEHAELNVGYNALAYHTMWFDDGSSAESRPYGAMGAATGGHNGHTIAHCAMGYFHDPYNHWPSDQMCIRIADEIRWTREAGFLTPDAPVLPHTVWTYGTQWATACCGSEFIPKVAWIDEMSRIGAGVPAPEPPKPDETGGEMWGVFWDLLDGRVEYLHGIGNLVQFSVQGVPRAYGLPLDELNYLGYQFGGFPVKKVDAATGEALKFATKQVLGVEEAHLFKVS
jgi:hypothetical protein